MSESLSIVVRSSRGSIARSSCPQLWLHLPSSFIQRRSETPTENMASQVICRIWTSQLPVGHLRSCMRCQAQALLTWQMRLYCRPTEPQGEVLATQTSRVHSGQASHVRPWQCAAHLPQHRSTPPGMRAGQSNSPVQQDGPNISRLAAHLQPEWDHAANAYLGGIIITPQSGRKVWWRGGMCKTGQLHRWQARIDSRSNGARCPNETGRAVCPCNDLAHNHPEVAEEWDCGANGERTPETVTAFSNSKAVWRCGLCGHSWSAAVVGRTRRTGCPRCGREASRCKTWQPSISAGAPHLVPEWDWEANKTHGWHPDRVTLMSHKKVHWVVQDECKLGLVHRWQASPNNRIGFKSGSPFPSGMAVCACNCLAVQCPEAATLWDHQANEVLLPDNVTVQSYKVAFWRLPNGRQWQQSVTQVVNTVWRREGLRVCSPALR